MNPFLKPTVATPQPDAHWSSPPYGSRPCRLPAPREGAPGTEVSGTEAPGLAAPNQEVTISGEHDTATRGPRASGRRTSAPGRLAAVRCRSFSPVFRCAALRGAGRYLGTVALAGFLLVPGWTFAVDINSATAQELQQVKGIGPKMAQVIIDERERGGRFESLADVSERVKGVGPKKAASFEAAGLTVGAAKAVATTQAKPAAGGAGKNRRSR